MSDLVAARLDAEERINNISLREEQVAKGSDVMQGGSLRPFLISNPFADSDDAQGRGLKFKPTTHVVKPLEETLRPNTTISSNINNNLSKPFSGSSSSERRARPQKEAPLKCPKCGSTNTKFCYHNNYSLSQPRYFCKTCRKYWTEVQTLPVGGGSRKNKRPSSSSSSSSSSTSSYSSVAKTTLPNVSEFIQLHNFDAIRNTNASVSTNTQPSALELLTGNTSRGTMNSFMPILDPNSVYTPGFCSRLKNRKQTHQQFMKMIFRLGKIKIKIVIPKGSGMECWAEAHGKDIIYILSV